MNTFEYMFRLLIFFLFFTIICLSSLGQSRDFIAVKKPNGITIKSFTSGSPVIFNTKSGKRVEGTIQLIRNDSVWVTGYRIQIIPTRLGVTMVDTASVYSIKTHYKDIASVYINKRAKRMPLLASRVLLFGGSGYIFLNAANHVLDGDTDLFLKKDNYQQLVKAGVTAFTGYAGWLIFRKTGFSRKHHKITYINLQ